MLKQNIYSSLLSRGVYFRKCDSSKTELIEFVSRLAPRDIGNSLVRIGDEGDGGYLLPDDFTNIKTCFSAGVGDNSSFEFDLAENHGIKCYLADYSVDYPALNHANFSFIKKFITEPSSESSISFLAWLESAGNDFPDTASPNSLLAMDIEGSEIEIFASNDPNLFKGFKYIVVELHNLERIVHKPFLNIYSLAIDKLLSNFVVCHLHPNNVVKPVTRFGITLPTVLEITLVNKKCLSGNDHPVVISSVPHPLDVPNSLSNPPINLSPHWFQCINK